MGILYGIPDRLRDACYHVALLLVLFGAVLIPPAAGASPAPTILITNLPPYGSFDPLCGVVLNADPSGCRVGIVSGLRHRALLSQLRRTAGALMVSVCVAGARLDVTWRAVQDEVNPHGSGRASCSGRYGDHTPGCRGYPLGALLPVNAAWETP